VFIKTGTAPGTLYYLHTDYLGSITALTNTTGSIVEQNAYDPWGRRRNPADWSFTNVTAPTLLSRGFTGHEHIDELTLINMNGRVYDPVLGMFISCDNFVPGADYSQAFNRYSYGLNNPLKFTDPDGEFPLLALIIWGAYFSGAQANTNGQDVWRGMALGAASSVVGMVVGAGVGSVVGGLLPSGTGGLGSTLLEGASGALSGGIAGGITNSMFGGNFKSGFINGTIGGGIMGALSGYMNYESQMAAFSQGCEDLRVEKGDPVPQTDDFLKRSQKVWYKDAPMDKINKFTTEHAPAFSSNNQKAKTPPEYNLSNQLTGRSSVYFNKNSAFSSAKRLFFTMGHEFVHVSQIGALRGLPLSIWRNPNFQKMIEFHAYNYENSIGGTRLSAFPRSVVRELATQFPKYFNAMSYTNFGWTTTANYKYPF
jgi:RHS repeat-associated protein